MSRQYLACVLLASSLLAHAAERKTPTYTDAMQAYRAKDYRACAAILVPLSKTPGPQVSAIAYSAARCLALSGRITDAFESLDVAIAADLVSVENLEADNDLRSLRDDAAWAAFLVRAGKQAEAHLAGVDRVLRQELLIRMARDQAGRNKLMGTASRDPALAEEMTRIDRENTAWLKQVLATHGWPTWRLVGKDGAKAAWLLVQHADLDRDFQKHALGLLEMAVADGQADGGDLAYLTDRVRVGEGKPQVYGTQFHAVGGQWVPEPIENEAEVDARRAAVGLPSLAEYERLMQQR